MSNTDTRTTFEVKIQEILNRLEERNRIEMQKAWNGVSRIWDQEQSFAKELLSALEEANHEGDYQHLPGIINEKIKEKKKKEADPAFTVYLEKYLSLHVAWKIILMITAVLLIVSGHLVTDANSCQLETALKNIKLENVPHLCKNDAIKTSSAFYGGGYAVLFGNCISLFLMVCLRVPKDGQKTAGKVFAFILSVCCIIPLACVTLITFGESEETNIDYLKLEKSMLSKLETHYTSDDINSGNGISDAWNELYIQYDCCAVREVEGTTNDFDNTPWCTTSGSCQATSSQIPKTCCKDVTKSNYQSAPSACHASVNPGTFKSSCISRMKELGNENVQDFTLTILFFLVYILTVIQAVDVYLAFKHLRLWCNEG